MPIAGTLLLHEADTTFADPLTTTGSVTTVAGRYYEVVVECPNVTVSSVTLPGTVSLTQIHTHIRGTITRVTALGGICSVGGTGSVGVDFSGAITGAIVHVSEWTGVDSTTPFIVLNVNQADASDASAPTEISFALPNALTNAGNCIRLAAVCNANTSWTAGTDFTELGDAGYTTPTRSLATQYDIGPADLTADGQFAASSQYAAIAWEINAAGGTTYAKTNIGILGLTGSGADVFTFVETGSGVMPLTGSGADFITFVETGMAVLGLTGSGASQMGGGVTYTKDGAAILGFTASGTKVVTYTETGMAVLGLTGSGVREGGTVAAAVTYDAVRDQFVVIYYYNT